MSCRLATALGYTRGAGCLAVRCDRQNSVCSASFCSRGREFGASTERNEIVPRLPQSAIAVLACVLLAGCATSPRSEEQPTPQRYITYYDHREQQESWYYWGKTTYLCMNQPPAGDAEFWCKIANDESRKREARCLAAGIVFGGFVRAGFTSEMMRKAIPDPRWLKNCTLGANVVVGGRWPYSISSGTHFYLILFPEQTNSSSLTGASISRSAPVPGRILFRLKTRQSS